MCKVHYCSCHCLHYVLGSGGDAGWVGVWVVATTHARCYLAATGTAKYGHVTRTVCCCWEQEEREEEALRTRPWGKPSGLQEATVCPLDCSLLPPPPPYILKLPPPTEVGNNQPLPPPIHGQAPKIPSPEPTSFFCPHPQKSSTRCTGLVRLTTIKNIYLCQIHGAVPAAMGQHAKQLKLKLLLLIVVSDGGRLHGPKLSERAR